MTVAGGDERLLTALLEASLERGAEARFEVDGHSMMPLIRPGDIVHVDRAAGTVPRLGEVVAVRFGPRGSLLVHRIVKKQGGSVLLRGDNNLQPDGWFPAADVLGRVTRVERRGRGVWFGGGVWGALVGPAVGAGLVRRFNRVAFPVYRWVRAHRRPVESP